MQSCREEEAVADITRITTVLEEEDGVAVKAVKEGVDTEEEAVVEDTEEEGPAEAAEGLHGA